MELFYLEMCHVYKSLTSNVEKCTSATDTAFPADRVSDYMTFKQVTCHPLVRASTAALPCSVSHLFQQHPLYFLVPLSLQSQVICWSGVLL